jgi:hypothetical protein
LNRKAKPSSDVFIDRVFQAAAREAPWRRLGCGPIPWNRLVVPRCRALLGNTNGTVVTEFECRISGLDSAAMGLAGL